MSDKKQSAGDKGNHLDEDDLERAEKGVGETSSLAANEEDVFISDTELDNPAPAAKKAAEKNDPTSGDGSEHS